MSGEKRRPRGPGKKQLQLQLLLESSSSSTAAAAAAAKKKPKTTTTTKKSKKTVNTEEPVAATSTTDSTMVLQQGIGIVCGAAEGDRLPAEVIAERIAKAKATAATIKKKRGAATQSSSSSSSSTTPATESSSSSSSSSRTRLGHMSTAEYAANVGARLASTVPETRKMSRTLDARDYRGIILFADSATDVVYCPTDVLAKVINPRPLSPRTVARLGPWTPCTGMGPGAGVGDDEDEDNLDGVLLDVQEE